MSLAVGAFTLLEQTAFLTQYARALDSRWEHSILHDSLADEIVGKISYDFAAFNVPANIVCQTALRAKMLDDRLRDFTSRHPDAVVVELGAGLNTPMLRVQPPDGVDWYSIDLPRVIALRDEVVPATDRAHSVAASLADDDWTDPIPAGRPTMLFADGLFAFVPVPVIGRLLARMVAHFGTGELAFNDYGRVGRLSWLAMKLAPQGMFKVIGSQWVNPGFRDARVPESWNPQLRLAEEASLAHAPEVELFPARLRAATKLAGRTAAGARKARILRYRF